MKTFIYCSGAHGKVVLDVLLRSYDKEFIGFIDDNPINSYEGGHNVYPLEHLKAYDPEEVEIIIANGNPKLRKKIYSKIYNYKFINVIDRSSHIASSATLGAGNTIGINCIINIGANVGNHCIINNSAVVEHDSSIEDFSTICPGVQIGGKTKLGAGAFICTGAIVLPHIKIGASSVVAAGSVVTKDIQDNVLVMGSPARVVCNIDGNFDWRKLL